MSILSKQCTIKEFLTRQYKPNENTEVAYDSSIWDRCDFEKAQKISDKIIGIFKDENMTYTDAYAMLGYVHKDLKYRSEQVNL